MRKTISNIRKNKIIFGLIISFIILLIFFTFEKEGIKWLIILFTFGSIYEILVVMMKNQKKERVVPFSLFFISIISMSMYFSYLMLKSFDKWFFLFLAVNNYATDTGGYFFGKISERMHWKSRKIAANISPNKTWVGFIAGLSLALLLCIIFKNILIRPNVIIIDNLTLVFLTIFGSAGNISGDLGASAFKRFVDIKDFSGTLGSHGGFLDKLDGFMGCSFVYSIFFIFVILKNISIPLNLNLF